jgi:hypothetical protein
MSIARAVTGREIGSCASATISLIISAIRPRAPTAVADEADVEHLYARDEECGEGEGGEQPRSRAQIGFAL